MYCAVAIIVTHGLGLSRSLHVVYLSDAGTLGIFIEEASADAAVTHTKCCIDISNALSAGAGYAAVNIVIVWWKESKRSVCSKQKVV
jgi:hypothetical protein